MIFNLSKGENHFKTLFVKKGEKKVRKKLTVLAKVLVVLGLVIIVGGSIFMGLNLLKGDRTKYETKSYDLTESFDKIVVDTAETDIEFKEAKDGKTVVVIEEEKTLTHSVQVENGTLKISSEKNRKWYQYITFSFRSPTVTVYLSDKEYAELKINGGTGKVTVPKPFEFGKAKIDISTGDIVFGATVKDSADIKATTGDISISDMSANELSVTVSTGKVDLKNLSVKNDITIVVTTGKLSAENVKCGNFSSNGSTGKVALTNVITSGKLQIERSTGDVTFEGIDAENITVHTSTGDVKGSILTAKVFAVSTTTGKVKLPESGSGGRCEVKTTTGDIVITIGK